MSTLYIEEYGGLDGDEQCAPQPPITTQTVTFTGTAGTSAAFNARTGLVRIIADAACHRLFSTNPTATTSHPRLGADTTEYFTVPAGQSLKVSAVAVA